MLVIVSNLTMIFNTKYMCGFFSKYAYCYLMKIFSVMYHWVV